MNNTSLAVCASIVFGIVLLGCLGAHAIAQETKPSALLYQTKIINPKGFERPYDLGAWVVTGRNSSVVFKIDQPSGSSSFALKSYKLNHKGKPISSTVTLLQDVYRFFLKPSIAAIWIDSTAAGTPAETEGFGLLGVAYPMSSAETRSRFAIATFDADGKLTSEFTTLMEVEAPTGQKIGWNSISLGDGDGKVAIAFSAFFSENSSTFIGYAGSKAFFAEAAIDVDTTSPSDLTTDIREIPLPNDGSFRLAMPFAPAWNGSRWLIPVRLSKYRTANLVPGITQSLLFGEDAMVAVVQGAEKKIALRRLFGHNDETSAWSYQLYFLPREIGPTSPAEPSGKKGGDLELFYAFKDTIDTSAGALYRYKYFYGIYTVNGNGKQVGPGIAVEIPQWQHGIGANENITYAANVEFCSSPLVLEDGEGIISLARSLQFSVASSSASPAELRYILELCLYSFDRETGKVKLMAIGNPQWDGLLLTPVMHWFRGKPSVLNSVLLSDPASLLSYYQEYYTRF
jgi:hypothetical protein